MELLTAELREAVPPLGSTDAQPDPIVHAKFFHPAFVWYVVEASAVDRRGRKVPLADPAAAWVVSMSQSDLRGADWTPDPDGVIAVDVPAFQPVGGGPGDIEFFGLAVHRAHPEDAELGFFWLSQLRQLAEVFPFFAPERDRYTFEPCRLSEVRARVERGDD